MGREEEVKTINGHEWRVTPFPGMEGVRTKVRLGKVLGPAFKAIDGDDIMDVNVGLLVASLFESVDEEKTPLLIKDLLRGTFVDGKDAYKTFDLLFQGNYTELYEGLAFVLSVNYGDFLELAGRFMNQAKSAPQKKSQKYRES